MLGAPMRLERRAMSLLEASLATAIVGSLLAILIPTFARSLRTSKTAEATQNLAELHARAAAYFADRHGAGPAAARWCLPVEAGPTPRFPSANRAEFDFQAETTAGHETWQALAFDPGPIRYRYSFVPEATGCGVRRAPSVAVVSYVAEGDLDEDGVLSTYERSDAVSEDGTLLPVGALHVRAGVE